MHGLATIKRLNDEATERCAHCSRFAIQVQHQGKKVHRVEVFSPSNDFDCELRLCTDCLSEHTENSASKGYIVKEVRDGRAGSSRAVQ